MKTEMERLVEQDNVRATVTYGAKGPAPEGMADMHHWTVTLRRKGRQLTVQYHTGYGLTEDPTAADVLSSLVLDVEAGEQDFESFCAGFGYGVDSRQVYATWQSCVKWAPRVRRFLGDAFDDYARAEH